MTDKAQLEKRIAGCKAIGKCLSCRRHIVWLDAMSKLGGVSDDSLSDT